MLARTSVIRSGLVAAAAAAAASLVATAALGGGTAGAEDGTHLTAVRSANTKATGLTTPNALSAGLVEAARAQGSMKVENPAPGIGYYGYDSVDNTPPLLPTLVNGSLVEAHKTEPDKNTYLVLGGQHGPDGGYSYGRHFLYQGHESGPGYVTRVNLDADAAHRVTVLASTEAGGKALPPFDGSTYDPFTKTLLMTSEAGCTGGGVWSGSPEYSGSSSFHQVQALGSGGYEGVQTASDGSIWLVEDIGGATIDPTNAKLANSYVYRFVPASTGDLARGTLQALQVQGPGGSPLDTTSSVTAPGLAALHTYGKSFTTRWVTVHTTTAVNLTESFCANDVAKAGRATAFKRPENGQFRPGSGFGEFYFTETGDTNADTTAGSALGGFGGVFRLRQSGPSAATGRLDLAFLGDKAHTGLDNLTFLDKDRLAVVEDAGDTLHTQRNALDSAYAIDVSKRRPEPLRFLAEGRDPSATLDSALGDAAAPGFGNDGDNEITGIHVSDGDPTPGGLLGAKTPKLSDESWRMFWTQQHGDNTTWEILRTGH